MSKKRQILITGASGQLGQCIKECAEARQISDRFLYTDYLELDITSPQALQAYFDAHEIGWCINCAAYTAVDKAESEPEKAQLLNATAPGYLAQICAATGAELIHISTDYVYHTQVNTPYTEDAATQPKGVYAQTKLLGDQAVLKLHPTAAVIRTSWVYSHHGANFVKTMIKVGETRPELSVVFDQIGTPTNAMHLADAILHILTFVEKSGQAMPAGIYHYSNEGITSWYDFAVAIFKHRNMPVKVNAIESRQYPTPTERPHFSALNKAKIKAQFQLEIPHWEVGLLDCLARL
jgi:dTDP-4-dehydrorhamnose reductase